MNLVLRDSFLANLLPNHAGQVPEDEEKLAAVALT